MTLSGQKLAKPRRVIVNVEWHPGELYPHVGYIFTNMARSAENVVAFYNKRGTCEQWIKEGKGAIKWTWLSLFRRQRGSPSASCAYNLGNFLRTLATPETIEDWSMTTLKEKLIKIGAKVVSRGRYVAFQMAEVGAPRRREEEICKCRITSEQPCCTRDEGRPLGLGLQDQGPNRHKPLQNNGWGGER